MSLLIRTLIRALECHVTPLRCFDAVHAYTPARADAIDFDFHATLATAIQPLIDMPPFLHACYAAAMLITLMPLFTRCRYCRYFRFDV